MRTSNIGADIDKGHAFDLIVIGTGTAASTAGHECSPAGWKVVELSQSAVLNWDSVIHKESRTKD